MADYDEEEETTRGVTVRDVGAADFIKAYANTLRLSDKMVLPEWVSLVKTASFKELAPYDPDWYYVRAAAIARRVYLRKGVGIGALSKSFGGQNRRGTLRNKKAKGTQGIIRHILQQLENMGVVEHCESKDDSNPALGKGRQITEKGQAALDACATAIVNEA